MLRSYDPQTCPDEGGISRFLQWDPYDEFSSGYVGMGNDPGNLVDPTGVCTGCLENVVVRPTAFQLMKSAARKANLGTRALGALKTTAGVLLSAGSAAAGALTSATGIGAVASAGGFLYGADLAATGVQQMITGQDQNTLTHKGVSQGLQSLGVNEQSAERSATFFEIGISAGAGMSANSAAAPNLVKAPVGKNTLPGKPSNPTVRSTAGTNQAAKSSTIVLQGAKSNYGHFVSKMPANAKSSASLKQLKDGNYLFEATSPGKVPGSKAVYQKWG